MQFELELNEDHRTHVGYRSVASHKSVFTLGGRIFACIACGLADTDLRRFVVVECDPDDMPPRSGLQEDD